MATKPRSTIKRRLTLSLFALAGVGAMQCVVGIYLQYSLSWNAQEQRAIAEAQVAQMESDMMHDAIRSDMLELASVHAAGDLTRAAKLEQDLAGHQARLDQSIGEVAAKQGWLVGPDLGADVRLDVAVLETRVCGCAHGTRLRMKC